MAKRKKTPEVTIVPPEEQEGQEAVRSLVASGEEERRQAAALLARRVLEQDLSNPDASDEEIGLNIGLRGEDVKGMVLSIRNSREYREQRKERAEEARNLTEAVILDRLQPMAEEIRKMIENKDGLYKPADQIRAFTAYQNTLNKIGKGNTVTINIDNRKVDLSINPKDWTHVDGRPLHLPTMEYVESGEGKADTLHWVCRKHGCQHDATGSRLHKAMHEEVDGE